ncbi:MAG: hypothetical protein NTY02_00450, partial [Acidobacteria bacterium]|nr:hypothetical protein [Acidobacteriota bacterium]
VPRSTASRVDDMLAQSERDRAGVLDANRAGDPEPARADPVAGAGMPVAMPESELTHARGSLAALLGVMNSLRSMPGRKAVAFLSAGVPRPDPSQVADVVAAAASAHAVIYTFELQGSPDDPRTTLDTAPLQALARNTGGLFVTLGRNADRTMDRTVTDLAACFTVGLQPAEGDGSAKPRTLRVSTSRKDVTVRSAAWLVAATEAEEVIPVPPVSISGAAPPDAPTVPAGAPPSRADARSPRDAELQVALGRVFDYVEAYEREYSVLVAEEEYRQNADRKSVRLRSDLLFVKPETSDTWISFRDVFEVDGTAVRDREDRLKRLFLEPGIEAGAQLTMIKDESARYNIGPFERNINVPQFPLKILNASNRDRFHFRLAGRTDTAGVQVWRIDFKETARPTLVTDLSDRDVPTAGWFTVEQGSGAIVETGLKFDEGAYTAVIVVQYRLDQNLGMWVPARMTEDYRILRQRGPGAFGAAYVTALDGTATYTKYRRFQVKTEETVTVPKKH